jgi:hypothetical protein
MRRFPLQFPLARTGDRTLRRLDCSGCDRRLALPVLIVGLLLIALPFGAQETKSGIAGAVHVCCHPGVTPLNWHAHYKGKLEFKRSSDGQLAAIATVDAEDKFVVYLRPGKYFLAQPPRPGPKSYVDLIIPGQRPMRSASITVEPGKLTSIRVSIDNGMR